MNSYCKLWINGKEYEFESDRKLMQVLRDDCHLKSVKDGCSEGACGTCTVLINGRAQKACTQKIGKLEGADILTVEGLSQREKDVFVYAFGEAGAVQCGFCIPGMVMCAKALLDKNPDPARVEIAAAIRNNICRCTGYKKIIDGIELAGKMLREDIPIEEQEEMIKVGSDFHRIDVEGKVLGTGIYVDDLEIDGMIYGGAVRTKYPRARVLSINTEKAKALPGVVSVLTAKDVPGSNKVGHLKHDWDAMIPEGDITRYMGDAIALVAAETPEILAQAKELVEVEYEVLKPLTCPEEALKPDAPALHEGGNILSHEHLLRGNADEVIANSKFKVTRHYETPWTEHAFLEPECAVAMPFDDGVFIHSTDQGTYDTQHECCILLGLPPEKVIVENKLVGGGFGGKEDVSLQHHAALLAYLTGRIVKMKFTRAESLVVHPKRHPFSIDMTTACDENGYLTAMKAVVVSDTGAYASLGGPVLQRACTHAAGPYNYQVIDIDGTAVYTNNPPAGAFRGFGVTQTCFATECNLNLLAEMVGIDPFEIRYRNAIKPGQVLPNGQIADDCTGMVETLDAVKDIYYSNEYVGIGCAMKNAGVGVGIPDYGRVRLLVKDGKIEIHSGASCIGQGAGTVLIQMIAETLNLPYTKIKWRNPNTSTAPDSGTTSGSRQTTVTGEAGIRAANKLKEALEGKSLEELEGQEFYGEYLAKTDPMGTPVPNPVSHVAYGFATQLCILNEDGTIKEMIGAHDVGKAVNPKGAEGQIEGGIVMSLGYALTESYPLKDCVPTGKFGTIGLFRADKTPPVKSILIEKPGLKTSYGAIGIGEITSIPTAPAVQGAYYKLTGEFQTSLPLKNTPYEKKRK
ncbi:selenium-dependent xanthine dehydrogenase [Novisyntrophococcus fermenticellae]|uniref:selenium-dependent xanthine dehydrogenase n=1 Tax=Novisyntrophococcus fermenticellae TaxID=2068655 RepID=UPI001E6133E6|nr:selenium-dependent xanthine dehydrogenase [Novisyntrophococcus fermenticellae]